MKPKPAVIDLQATEIEDEPAAHEGLDPLADEPAPSADDPSLFEAEPRSQLGALIAAGVAGAAIAILGFILLLTSGLVPLGGASDPALGSRVAELEAQLQKAAETQPASPAGDGALRDQVQVLARQIEEMRAAPPGAPQAPAPSAAPNPGLEARVNELAARIDAQSQALESRINTAAFDQLAARVNELAAKTSEERAPDPAVQQALAGSKSAAALAAVSSLESAVSRGVPYAAALGAVKRQLPDASYAALEKDAERGLPAAALLAGRLSAKLEKAPAPASAATGFMDRLAEGARGLVRVKPVDGSVPEISAADPWSARNAVSIRLGQGDYAGALADWEKLDNAAKDATRDEAAALKARLEADAALDALRAAALGGAP